MVHNFVRSKKENEMKLNKLSELKIKNRELHYVDC